MLNPRSYSNTHCRSITTIPELVGLSDLIEICIRLYVRGVSESCLGVLATCSQALIESRSLAQGIESSVGVLRLNPCRIMLMMMRENLVVYSKGEAFTV